MRVLTKPFCNSGTQGFAPHLIDSDPSATSGQCCEACGLRACCVTNPDDPENAKPLDGLTVGHRTVRKGNPLYRVGDRFGDIFAVRTGSFKKVSLRADGREQVTDFYLAGEPLGFDGIWHGHYASDAVALKDSSVCVISFPMLERLGREAKAVSHHVYRVLSAEVVRQSNQMLSLGSLTAEERVATFLVDMLERSKQRASQTKLTLSMTRKEAGSFLGLKLETVSRVLSRFQKEKLIEVSGKAIDILDLERLRETGLARA